MGDGERGSLCLGEVFAVVECECMVDICDIIEPFPDCVRVLGVGRWVCGDLDIVHVTP